MAPLSLSRIKTFFPNFHKDTFLLLAFLSQVSQNPPLFMTMTVNEHPHWARLRTRDIILLITGLKIVLPLSDTQATMSLRGWVYCPRSFTNIWWEWGSKTGLFGCKTQAFLIVSCWPSTHSCLRRRCHSSGLLCPSPFLLLWVMRTRDKKSRKRCVLYVLEPGYLGSNSDSTTCWLCDLEQVLPSPCLFPHLYNEDNNSLHFIESLWALNMLL